MRTLFEIIEDAKNGNRPTPDECYWAMLALDSLHTLDGMAMLSVHEKSHADTNLFGPRYISEESFNRNKRALSVDPQQFVGWSNDPANPDYQKMRSLATKVFKKVTGL